MGALLGDGAQLRLGDSVFAVEQRPEQPVYDHVRIAPDGRREVGVGAGGQREMAGIVHAVARLLERTQHEKAQDPLFRFAFELGDQLLIIPRANAERAVRQCDFFARFVAVAPLVGISELLDRNAAERVAELFGHLLELHHPLGVGRLVDAVNRRDVGALQARCDCFIGGEHEFLDNTVRDVARRA